MRILRPCGLRMTGWGAVLFCVGRDDPARPLAPSLRELSPKRESLRVWRRERPFQNPFLFPCWKKKRFLGSKEKEAFEIWSAVGCSSAACVFTPPLGTSPSRYGLCGRNRERFAFYLSAAWVGESRGLGRRAAKGRPYPMPTTFFRRGGSHPPARSGATFPLCHSKRPPFVILSRRRRIRILRPWLPLRGSCHQR